MKITNYTKNINFKTGQYHNFFLNMQNSQNGYKCYKICIFFQSYTIYMYKQDLALYNPQGSCAIKPNQPTNQVRTISSSTMPAQTLLKYHFLVWALRLQLRPNYGMHKEHMKQETLSVKTPQGKYTSKFRTGCITKVNSLLSVQIDGIPYHMKDLHLFLVLFPS